jgi:hypothetical protein
MLTISPVRSKWGVGSVLCAHARGTLELEADERWYHVHTQPNSERRAQLHLGAQGSRRIFPQSKRQSVMRASLGRSGRPYFRATYSLSSIWDATAGRQCGGVSSLFTCEGRPVPVPEGGVETLIQNTDEANLTLFNSGLTTEQSVRILSGPFANFVGTLERLDDAGRVRVLLDMMGTAVPVGLRRTAICPAA